MIRINLSSALADGCSAGDTVTVELTYIDANNTTLTEMISDTLANIQAYDATNPFIPTVTFPTDWSACPVTVSAVLVGCDGTRSELSTSTGNCTVVTAETVTNQLSETSNGISNGDTFATSTVNGEVDTDIENSCIGFNFQMKDENGTDVGAPVTASNIAWGDSAAVIAAAFDTVGLTQPDGSPLDATNVVWDAATGTVGLIGWSKNDPDANGGVEDPNLNYDIEYSFTFAPGCGACDAVAIGKIGYWQKAECCWQSNIGTGQTWTTGGSTTYTTTGAGIEADPYILTITNASVFDAVYTFKVWGEAGSTFNFNSVGNISVVSGKVYFELTDFQSDFKWLNGCNRFSEVNFRIVDFDPIASNPGGGSSQGELELGCIYGKSAIDEISPGVFRSFPPDQNGFLLMKAWNMRDGIVPNRFSLDGIGGDVTSFLIFNQVADVACKQVLSCDNTKVQYINRLGQIYTPVNLSCEWVDSKPCISEQI